MQKEINHKSRNGKKYRAALYHMKARDLWPLTNRITRKILSHTVGIFLNKLMGNPPLQLALLLKP